MKKILMIILITFIPFALHADPFDDSTKITKIKAIILDCDRSISQYKAENPETECSDSYLDEYINKSPIKFITRKNLGDLLNEQNISQSGLTNEKVAAIGKLYGASHILFYKQVGPWGDVLIDYRFKLVNTSTSEIEYSTEVYIYKEDYYKKQKPGPFVFGIDIGRIDDMKFFFIILNNHSEKAEKTLWHK
jgi:hypothetical protein